MPRIQITAAAMLAAVMLTSATPALAHSDRGDRHGNGRVATYEITGDEGGSKFEGIGTDERRGTIYVSEVTGGEIHRGTARSPQLQEWIAGDGTDGRYTARGIATDSAGRVYIAGGPNGIDTATGQDNGRPDLWVYAADGTLLAALQAPGQNAFLNDVTIGPDGAAYFTNSNAPQIFRVAADRTGAWTVGLWADATGTIATQQGFNLGGIVLTNNRRAFVVAQGTTGQLWRFDARTGAVSQVATGGADLTNADGLVLRGSTLTVVRNFSRQLATLHLASDGRSATPVEQRATDPERVLTTAAVLRGQTFFVDSKFDETVASGPYEVVSNPFGS